MAHNTHLKDSIGIITVLWWDAGSPAEVFSRVFI